MRPGAAVSAIRWWRVAVLFRADDAPYSWTLHVRAFTDERARRLVAARVREHAGRTAEASLHVYACVPSDPLRRVTQREEIVAAYGPYRRAWDDPLLADTLAACGWGRGGRSDAGEGDEAAADGGDGGERRPERDHGPSDAGADDPDPE